VDCTWSVVKLKEADVERVSDGGAPVRVVFGGTNFSSAP